MYEPDKLCSSFSGQFSSGSILSPKLNCTGFIIVISSVVRPCKSDSFVFCSPFLDKKHIKASTEYQHKRVMGFLNLQYLQYLLA
jgi:hypothetical protein